MPDDSALRAEVPASERRYLDLLKRCLTREIFADQDLEEVLLWSTKGPLEFLGNPTETWPILAENGLRLVQPVADVSGRREGTKWSATADTMVGAKRLTNVEKLVRDVLANDVPGDFVETGIWRGGTIALMRAMLDVCGDPERTIWACDSFQGLPKPDLVNYPQDVDLDVGEIYNSVLAVSIEQVKENIARYGLLDERIQFVEGWFKDSLPTAPIEQISLLRLDGDLYESTMDALIPLEPKVSVGGYVIVDDYSGLEACKAAVDDYRTANNITDQIHAIDWTGVYWKKTR